MRSNVLTIFSIFFLLAACAPPFSHQRHRHHDPVVNSTAQTKKPVSACQANYKVWESGHFQLIVEPKKTITIHREKQRRKYYDCQGKLYRDKIETVKAPHADINLRPSHSMVSVKAVRIFNLDSCADTSADLGISGQVFNAFLPINSLTGSKNGKITIRGDESPGFFRFLMNKGLNRIYYTYFEECSSTEIIGSNSPIVETCEKLGKTYSGIFNVYVDYTETLKPGAQEIHPSAEYCKSNQSAR